MLDKQKEEIYVVEQDNQCMRHFQETCSRVWEIPLSAPQGLEDLQSLQDRDSIGVWKCHKDEHLNNWTNVLWKLRDICQVFVVTFAVNIKYINLDLASGE